PPRSRRQMPLRETPLRQMPLRETRPSRPVMLQAPRTPPTALSEPSSSMTVVSPSSFPAAPELAQRSTAPGVAARETATTTGASEMHAATVRWLVRLRWLAVVGQALAVLLVAQSVSSTGTAVLMG